MDILKKYACCILIVFCLACEKEADIELPEAKSMPVMYCYIGPGTDTLRLSLTWSQPVFNNSNQDISSPVQGADVRISSDQGMATFQFSIPGGMYELPKAAYPIYPGKKYKVEVTTPDGKYAWAETEVPAGFVEVKSASWQTITENQNEKTRVSAEFTDEPAGSNYYALTCAQLTSPFPPDTFFQFSNERKLATDAGKNGAAMSVYVDEYSANNSVVAFDIYLINCNKDYYLFTHSIQSYQEGNPFAEPSLIYTNVKGGLGVVAGYTMSKYRLLK